MKKIQNVTIERRFFYYAEQRILSCLTRKLSSFIRHLWSYEERPGFSEEKM